MTLFLSACFQNRPRVKQYPDGVYLAINQMIPATAKGGHIAHIDIINYGVVWQVINILPKLGKLI